MSTLATRLNPRSDDFKASAAWMRGLVDDLIIYRLEDELFLVVVNAANIRKDWDWLNSLNHHGAELQDISDDTALMALSGPLSLTTLQSLTDAPVGDLTYYAHMRATVADIDNVLVATTGYTGERTFELYVRADQALKLWEALMAAGGIDALPWRQAQGGQPMRNLVCCLIQCPKTEDSAAIGKNGRRLVGCCARQIGKMRHGPSLSS